MLPVVEISPLVQRGSSAAARRAVGEALVTAARSPGFFYVHGHGVPNSTTQEARDQARRFFSLPQAEKDQIHIRRSVSVRGYQRVGDNVTQGSRDLHEALDLYRDFPGPATPPTNHGINQWPDAERLPGFRPFFEDYVSTMSGVGNAIMRGFALGLGEPEASFEPYYDQSFWIMRLIRYPELELTRGAEHAHTHTQAQGCGQHTDYGCLTLVNADPGHDECLMAQMTSGEWVAVKAVPGAFVVNIGDMLARWTNGLFRATPHRVLPPTHGAGDRVSVPFFFEPNYDATIRPLDCCIEPGAAAAFEAVRYGDHLLQKTSTNFPDL